MDCVVRQIAAFRGEAELLAHIEEKSQTRPDFQNPQSTWLLPLDAGLAQEGANLLPKSVLLRQFVGSVDVFAGEPRAIVQERVSPDQATPFASQNAVTGDRGVSLPGQAAKIAIILRDLEVRPEEIVLQGGRADSGRRRGCFRTHGIWGRKRIAIRFGKIEQRPMELVG